jgi:hypothetical protein
MEMLAVLEVLILVVVVVLVAVLEVLEEVLTIQIELVVLEEQIALGLEVM